MNRLLRAAPRQLWPIAIALAVSLGPGVAPAGAAPEIEGVWSFNGGQVAIHPTVNGQFAGVVVTPTKFSECVHRAGEVMWTGMTLQPDGSYWGFHQWLFETTCEPNPQPGPTAWRVLQKPDGSKYLYVCFSEPEKAQPTIAPNGSYANSTFGCEESAPTAPLPVVASGNGSSGAGARSGAEVITFRKTVILPKVALCVKQHSLKVKLHDPRYDPLKEVVVTVRGRTVAKVHGIDRLKRGIVLKGLPTGSYTIKIVATTVLDQKLSGRRTYHSCGKRSSRNIPLHRPRRTRRR
jgi:hypothetical protein